MDLEFYNSRARFYGGALYIECSICSSERSILFYYNLLVGARYALSNAAKLGGNLTIFSVYNDTNCRAHNMPHENGTLVATQPCKIQSSHEATVKGNFTNDPYTKFHFWLHDLHFDLTITDCFNNLYGPAQVFICFEDYYNNSCGDKYEYMVDSIHNNIIMVSNDTSFSSFYPLSQLIVTANGYYLNSVLYKHTLM